MPENRAAQAFDVGNPRKSGSLGVLAAPQHAFFTWMPGVKLTRTFDIGDCVTCMILTVTTTIGPETQWRVDARNPMSTGETQLWR
jgi:hypothetical protein